LNGWIAGWLKLLNCSFLPFFRNDNLYLSHSTIHPFAHPTIQFMTEQDVKALLAKLPLLKAEIGKVIVGQEAVLDEVLVALLAGGHALLEGVPGLAKTLLVRTLAQATDLPFRRIQFTPDLMPTDILGTEVLEEDHGTGRRDKPHPAQNPGGPARSHAGRPRDLRRPGARAAQAVLLAGYAKPY
jgi:hypothetical protein